MRVYQPDDTIRMELTLKKSCLIDIESVELVFIRQAPGGGRLTLTTPVPRDYDRLDTEVPLDFSREVEDESSGLYRLERIVCHTPEGASFEPGSVYDNIEFGIYHTDPLQQFYPQVESLSLG